MRTLLIAVATTVVLAASDLALAQTPTSSPTYIPGMVSAQDARADVALLRRALETVHPGLYRYASKADIDAAFTRLEAATSGPISELALGLRLSEIRWRTS